MLPRPLTPLLTEICAAGSAFVGRTIDGVEDRYASKVADATVPQIATFTGHSLRDVEAILDAHYLGRDVQLAELAVMKLEARTKL